MPQVLSAIIRIRRHSSTTVSSLSPTHGRRPPYEELRLCEAESNHRVEHRGTTLWSTNPQREWAESTGWERAGRWLFVGLACRGLPQGTPRVIPWPIFSSRSDFVSDRAQRVANHVTRTFNPPSNVRYIINVAIVLR